MGSVALEGFGGGGVGLNFKIIGNPRPETAKENTIWIDTDTEISSWAFASSEHDAMRSGRNFLSYPYLSSTTTVDGIHFEDNKDGSVTVNGTKNNDGNNPQFPLNSGVYLPAGNYYVSGCPKNVPAMVLVWDADNNFALAYDAGNGARFDLGSPRHVNVVIEITGNQTISNAVFNPRITSLHGMVWITTGISGNVGFNALKKNGIQIHPIAAKQFLYGAWVDKTAKSWQNEKWNDWWDGTLYDAGNEYTFVTGGWKAVNASGASATLNSDGISFNCWGDSDRNAAIYTKNKVTINGRTLYVNVDVSSNNQLFIVGLSTQNTKYVPEGAVAQKQTSGTGNMTLEVPLSGVSQGEYYVFAATYAAKAVVKKVWFG